MEGTVKISELFEYMRDNNLVLTKRDEAEVLSERDKALRKSWLKVGDIFKGEIWGDITKTQITRIIKTLPSSEIRINQRGKKHYYEVRKSAVEIKAKERGII